MLKLLLVLLYFYILIYIFIISLISFIIRKLAKGLFRGNRGSKSSRNPLLLALYNPVLVRVIIGNKEI